MTDIRARFIDALAQHLICDCGEWADNLDETAAHLADVLLALEGVAVVETPERSQPPEPQTDDEGIRCLGVWEYGECGSLALWDDDGAIAMADGQELSASEARALAAALLAAADHADRLARAAEGDR